MNGAPQTSGRIAAFFDLDGTLIPAPSLEFRFFTQLRRNACIPFINYLRWGIEALRLLPQGLVAVQHGNKRYLTGMSTDLALRYLESIPFFEEGIARVAWHARQNDEIVLVSGTPEPLARLAATALECELEARGFPIHVMVCATRLAEKNGRWTGDLLGEPEFGLAKASAAETLARNTGFKLRECHAYGNSLSDRHLLSAVGHAHAVNPGRAMAALANEKDWPIWHWHLGKRVVSKENTLCTEEIQHIEGRT